MSRPSYILKKVNPLQQDMDKSAADRAMSKSVEEHFLYRDNKPESCLEEYLAPGGPMSELYEEMKTPDGNRNAVESILNTWIAEKIALDRTYMATILERAENGNSLVNLQDYYDHKSANEQAIISLMSAKKKLLTLPGVSYTQVNLCKGHQQINNGRNENEKIDGEV